MAFKASEEKNVAQLGDGNYADGFDVSWKHAVLHEAITSIAMGRNGKPDARRLGYFMRRMKGKVCGRLRFANQVDPHGNPMPWWVEEI